MNVINFLALSVEYEVWNIDTYW